MVTDRIAPRGVPLAGLMAVLWATRAMAWQTVVASGDEPQDLQQPVKLWLLLVSVLLLGGVMLWVVAYGGRRARRAQTFASRRSRFGPDHWAARRFLKRPADPSARKIPAAGGGQTQVDRSTDTTGN
ncbi:MAG TPA: hypothetical protein VG713_04025 [Pirellulales bacterium]|nr:hypothetical protein [Pirellulales bacterium]